VSGEVTSRTVLPQDPSSARVARLLVRRQLVEAGVGEPVLDAAVLVASELVTNAVRHGSGEVVLEIGTGSDEARIEVSDASTGVPSVVSPYEGGGRGMLVVDAVSSGWGVERQPVGKTVWARFALGPR
jgi:anti-sigma regulatory factor (Ser/Thr protein kinase)